MANELMIIMPYWHAGTWVFDDEATGLCMEPFVAGIPEMINDLVGDIPNALHRSDIVSNHRIGGDEPTCKTFQPF
jgi:hypothetical protein